MIEKPRVIATEQGAVTARIVIDGQVLPNVLLPGKIFEEIEAGERVTMYGIFTKKKDKTENKAIIYAVKSSSGKLVAAKQYQIKVPVPMLVAAVPLMITVAVAGCFISPYPIHLITGSVNPSYLVPATFKAAAWEGIAAGVFMVGWPRTMMISDVDMLEEILSQQTSEFVVAEIQVVTPGWMNKTGKWIMEGLSGLLVGYDIHVMSGMSSQHR